jgi:hypothetical protein
MATATMPATERPMPSIPNGANKSYIWRDRDGTLQRHAIELPVDKNTDRINGRLFACPVPTCGEGEWVIEPNTAPKKTFCPNHGDSGRLAMVPLDDTQQDPVAVGRQRQLAYLARLWSSKRSKYADAIRAGVEARVVKARAAAVENGSKLATDMKGHVPSLLGSVAVEIGVIYTVDMTGALETTAITAAVGVGGLVAGYYVAVMIEKVRAALRKERLQGRAAKKARERGLWIGRGAISTALFLTVTGITEALAGLEAGGIEGGLKWGILALVGAGLAWWTNAAHWTRLWQERKRLRDLAEENARRAAEAEAARAEAEAERARREAELRERLADIGAYDEDNPLHQGQRMQIEWERISSLHSAKDNFPRIVKTRIVPEQTREITAPDPETGKRVRIGWEFTGTCEPGALVTPNGMVPPIMAAKQWIVSVLFDGQYDASMIALFDMPENRQNTFLVTITQKARLGAAVLWRAENAVRVDHNGVRYGYLGRSLLGDELEEILYNPGQPFGGQVIGTTGGGKGGHATRHLCNLLLAHILPVLYDPKKLVDYGDFVGLFPIGWTRRHRRIILTSLVAERQRREGRLASAPKRNKYGAEVHGESKWNTHDPDTGEIGVYGEPIESVWDEFHDVSKDEQFTQDLTNHIRFQRAAGIGALLLSQGGGLADWGNSELRDLINQCTSTYYRTGDMQSRLGGNRNQTYSTADLPKLPGMCLRQAPGSPDVPLWAVYITRDPNADDTVYTTLWGKGAEPVMQIDDPMNWISEETKALWEETGLMPLWRLAREGGIAALLADDQEDEDDDEAAMMAGMLMSGYSQAVARPTTKAVDQARMNGRDVLMAILHESPGINRDGIMKHSAWHRAPGWSGPPAAETITRAAKQLDPTVGGTEPLQPGQIKKIDRGPKSASWTLTTAGAEQGRMCAARLELEDTPGAPPRPVASGLSPAVVAEQAAQKAAEIARMIKEETRLASRS